MGLTVVIQAAPSGTYPAGQLRLPRYQPAGTTILRADGEDSAGSSDRRDEHHPSFPAQFIRLPHRNTLHHRRQDPAGKNGTAFACEGCSTCCPGASGGFQCCQQGFKCCTSSTGAGSCCPDDDTPSSDEEAAGLSTTTITHTVTSFTGGQTIGTHVFHHCELRAAPYDANQDCHSDDEHRL